MDKLKEDYLTLFSQFYRKMLKHHKRKRVLSENFNELIIDMANIKEQRQVVRPAKSTQLIEQKSKSRGNSPSKSPGETQRNIQQKCYKTQDVLYSSSGMIKTFVFGYLYQLINFDNASEFQQISQRTGQYLQQTKTIDQMAIKRVNFIWSRIGQMFTKRSNLRWIGQMKQSYSQFTDEFLKILLVAILKNKVKIQQITDSYLNSTAFLEDVAKQLNICMVLVKIVDGKVVNAEKRGQQKKEIVIAQEDMKYIMLNQVPGGSTFTKNATTTKADSLNITILKTVESLLNGYKQDSQKLMSLEFLKDQNEKQIKIKKHLSTER